MKTKQLIFRSMLVIATSALLITGCKKEKNDDAADNDTSSANDNALAENTFNDVSNISDEASSGSLSSYKTGGAQGILSGCATITLDTANAGDADTLTINFGLTNCMCLDGRNRRGEIIIISTDKYKADGATWTTTFNNYFVDDNQVMAIRTGVNNGHNSAGHLSWTIHVNGTIILASGGTITWTATRTREMIEGESTPQRNDDKYSITGSGSGSSAKGLSYTVNITTALIRDMALGCRKHFTKGTVELTPSGKLTRTIDFGDGTCDDKATVTINGKTYDITLK